MKRDGGGFETSLFQGNQCQPAAALPCALLLLLLLWVTLFSCGQGCFVLALSVSGTFSMRWGVLLRAVLLVPKRVATCGAAAVREEFAVHGAACASARCRVRCWCCTRGVLLRAGLLVFERVAACSVAAVCEIALCR